MNFVLKCLLWLLALPLFATTSLPAKTSPETLIRIAEEKLSASLKKQYRHFELKAMNIPHPGQSPAAAYQMHFNDRPSSTVCVWLEHGKEVRQVWFKVKAWCDRWVARKPLHAKSRIQAQDFVLEERECLHLPKGCTQFPKDLQLKQAVAEGEVLSKKNIEALSLVKRNESVRVRLKSGAVSLDTEGVALSDGILHQKINIKNPGSKKMFKAIVTGSREVEVYE